MLTLLFRDLSAPRHSRAQLNDAGIIDGGVVMTERIEINPEVMQGKPVIRGTRVPVELLLRKLSEGATIGDLLGAYPRLVADDIRAALDYAADTIAHETVVTLSSQ